MARSELISRILLGALVLFTAAMFAKSVKRVWEGNDFGTYTMAGRAAIERNPDLYEMEENIRERKYYYPPSAAVMMTPLAPFSEKAAGVIFSALKTACLITLMIGAVMWTGMAPPDKLWRRALIAITVFMIFRPVSNDIGNGQINLIVAACAISGAWMMMESRRFWWMGSLLLAIAIATKATPLMLLALPLLHKRWAALAAAIGFAVLIAVVLPIVWYGPDLADHLGKRFRDRSLVSTEEIADRDRQTSLHEFIVFTASQITADADQYEWNYDKRRLYYKDRFEEDGTPIRAEIEMPFGHRANQMIWFATGMIVGVSYLVLRFVLWRGRQIPWQWDLAVLVVMQVFLAPLVRKAHLVILFPAIGFIVCSIHHLLDAHGWKAAWRLNRPLFILCAVAFVFFWMSEEVFIPLPGLPMPYHPMLFLAQVLFLVILFLLAKRENTEAV